MMLAEGPSRGLEHASSTAAPPKRGRLAAQTLFRSKTPLGDFIDACGEPMTKQPSLNSKAALSLTEVAV